MAGYEKVGVLAEPADAGTMRCRPIDQRVVVSNNAGAISGPFEFSGHPGECLTKVCVMVTGGISSDPPVRFLDAIVRILRLLMIPTRIRPRPHHERCGSFEKRTRLGGSIGIAIGELHRAVEPEVSAFP